ncbi:MAG: hypothetical protein QW548_03265 [Candidatus Aenigmatarchaeota archaeon]
MEISVAYILIVILAGFAIAVAVISAGQAPRTVFEQRAANITTPGLVTVEAPLPTVAAVGMKDCKEGTNIFEYACTYKPDITRLIVKSKNATDRLAVAVSYGGLGAIVPCRPSGPWGPGIPSGPCKIEQRTEDGKWQAVLDLKPVLRAKYLDSPPPINASSRLVFDERTASGLLANGQRLMLGNYTFDVTVRDVLFGLLKDFEITVRCRDEVKIVDIDAEESAHMLMCGRDVDIRALWKWGALYGRLDIAVSALPGEVRGVPLAVSFWQYDDAFRFSQCGMAAEPPVTYYESIPFDAATALAEPECAKRFLGSYQLYAPVDAEIFQVETWMAAEMPVAP